MTATGRVITPRQYYAHRLQVRRRTDTDLEVGPVDDALHRWGRLFQEYCCMALVKLEAERVNFIRRNQQLIRADLYNNLADMIGDYDA